jgi:hypothetical protein
MPRRANRSLASLSVALISACEGPLDTFTPGFFLDPFFLSFPMDLSAMNCRVTLSGWISRDFFLYASLILSKLANFSTPTNS